MLTLLVGAVLASSCHTSRAIKPMEEGEWRIGANYGGPRVNDFNIPLMSAYVARGATEQTTQFAGLNITSLMFNTVQLDFGELRGIRPYSSLASPGLSWYWAGNSLLSTRDYAYRLYPEIGANAYWTYGVHTWHISGALWTDPTFFMTEYGKGQLLAPAFTAGYRMRWKALEAHVEYKLLNPTQDLVIPQATVPGLYELGGRGIYFGAAINF